MTNERIEFPAGTSYEFRVGYENDDGTPVTGLDGYTAHFQARNSRDASRVVVDVTGTWDAVSGVATFALTPADTASLVTPTRLVCGASIISSDGSDIIPLLEAVLVLNSPVYTT